MYDLMSYASMMNDAPRIGAYLEAMQKVVTPESVVLELGTGTGVVAFAAALAGAKRVIALEPNDAIAVAREIARDNGFTNIEFRQQMSTDLVLDEKADILISDMRGGMPLLQGHIPAIVDARERLIKPNGIQIAQSDRLYAVPVDSADAWDTSVGAWRSNPINIDMSAAEKYIANLWHSYEFKPKDLLADPVQWAEIDYRTVTNPNVSGSRSITIERAGVFRGLCVFFETQLDAQIAINTGPGQPLMAYGRNCFPVAKPFDVVPGDILEFSLAAHLIVDDYTWSWSGRCGENRFSQTTFGASPLTSQALAQVDVSRRPMLNETGQVIGWMLARFDGGSGLEDIAREIRVEFPEQFPSNREAMAYVAENALRYGVRT